MLAEFDLVAIGEEVRSAAARARPVELRTLDAIHLASCLSIRAHLDTVICYDRRLTTALRSARLPVDAPA